MTILDVYQQYHLPPNLQRHQLEVAAVCQVILDGWNGGKIDPQLTLTSALLHDMANIIKFKRPFLGELEINATYWKQQQDAFVAKYGTDVKAATREIVSELGLPGVDTVLREMDELVAGESEAGWEARVVQLADMHVAPTGVVSFQQRLTDLIERYQYHGNELWIASVKENYRLVKIQTSCKLENIDKNDYLMIIEQLKTNKISPE